LTEGLRRKYGEKMAIFAISWSSGWRGRSILFWNHEREDWTMTCKN